MAHGVKVIEKEVQYDDGIKVRSWLIPIIISTIVGLAVAYGGYTAVAATYGEKITRNEHDIQNLDASSQSSNHVIWENLKTYETISNTHEVLIAKQGIALENLNGNVNDLKNSNQRIIDILLKRQ